MFRCSVGHLQPSISALRNRLVLFLRRPSVSSDATSQVESHCFCHSHCHLKAVIISRLYEDDEFFSLAARRLGSEGFSDDVLDNIGSALFTVADAHNFLSDLQS